MGVFETLLDERQNPVKLRFCCAVRFPDVASKFSVIMCDYLHIATKYAQVILQKVLGPDINVAYWVLLQINEHSGPTLNVLYLFSVVYCVAFFPPVYMYINNLLCMCRVYMHIISASIH